MNIKKLTTLAAVGIVSLLSTFQTPTKTEAALTAPSSWDIKYAHDGYEYGITNPTNNTANNYLDYPTYTRTSDGAYYNYTTTIDNNDTTIIPIGLTITHTFNRSNTYWNLFGSEYQASDTKIGSDNTVGSINKWILTFNNQTNKDYFFYGDFSSNGGTNYQFIVDYGGGLIISHGGSNSIFQRYILPSFSSLTLQTATTTGAYYLDAWYLQDLGVSDAYNAGYDQGETDGYQDGLNNNPNILLNGFQAMVGILVNFFLMIVNLEVFGVSITGIFSIIVIFVGIVWVLKLIRG